VQFYACISVIVLITLTHKEYDREGLKTIVLPLNPAKYGKLLSLAMPKHIETDAEMDHFIEMMEPLSRAIEHPPPAGRNRTSLPARRPHQRIRRSRLSVPLRKSGSGSDRVRRAPHHVESLQMASLLCLS
jgi:hypothetical protein